MSTCLGHLNTRSLTLFDFLHFFTGFLVLKKKAFRLMTLPIQESERVGRPCSRQNSSRKIFTLYFERLGCCSLMALMKLKILAGISICLPVCGLVDLGMRLTSFLSDLRYFSCQRKTVRLPTEGKAILTPAYPCLSRIWRQRNLN